MDAQGRERCRYGRGRFITPVRSTAITAVAVLVFAAAASAVPYPAGKDGGWSVLRLTASFPDGIVPGGSEPVAFTAEDSGKSPVFVKKLHLAGISVDSAHAACVTSDFSMDDVTESQWVPGHAVADRLSTEGTLSYANRDRSQDACRGATLTLTLTRQ